MPEVRHGSKFRAQSDPGLPAQIQPVTSPLHAGSESQVNRPTNALQHHARSADDVPIQHTWSNSRLGNVLLRGNSEGNKEKTEETEPIAPLPSNGAPRKASIFPPLGPIDPAPRTSVAYSQRDTAPVYYDSRAAGHSEWKRRAKTLEEYYEDNPDLLPQLPFSWHHGKRRWRLWLFAFFVFVDASAVPIALYYGLKYAGGVEEYIIFAVVTTIWGGPTYLEFGIRTLRLIKKENFYRPLGSDSKWTCDFTNWATSIAIFVLTALFIIGSAPRDTWLRVVAMAGPSVLWSYGSMVLAVTLLHRFNIPAPFRISSTPKGGKVHPGAYYIIEDVLAVNARCGRPYREAIMARYKASPRFRELMYHQSLWWSVPSLIMALILTIIGVIPQVPEDWSYGVCWAVPFGWAFIWGVITIPICKAKMVQERLEWEAGEVPGKQVASPVLSPVASPPA